MSLFFRTDTWRKSLLLYRFLRYRKGFGVHSPFAFSFITKVVDERCKYYAYNDIELIRRQLIHNGSLAVKNDIKRSHGELLFRVVNWFKPKTLLQIGAASGIGTLYLTACSSKMRTEVLASNEKEAEETAWSLHKFNQKEVQVNISTGDYKKNLQKVLTKMEKVDFFFLHAPNEKENNQIYVEEVLKHIHPDSIFFIEGIRANQAMRQLWKKLCLQEETAVTFDLYNVGIAFFNKRLYKRNYTVFF